MLRFDTPIDAIVVDALFSTENEAKARYRRLDPEPSASVHAFWARQPVPGAKKSRRHEMEPVCLETAQKKSQLAALEPNDAIMRLVRCSRSRCSGVP